MSLHELAYVKSTCCLPQQVDFLWIEYRADQPMRQSRTWERLASWSPGTQQGPSHTLQAYTKQYMQSAVKAAISK